MKLSELIERLDSKSEPYYGGDLEDFMFGYSLGVNLSEHGFTSKPVTFWCCTDTMVGASLIYRDNEPICFCMQRYRKSDPEFHWISEEAYKTTKTFIYSLREKLEGDYDDEIKILNFDEETTDTYKIEYISQLYREHSHALYEGKLYEIDWEGADFLSRRHQYRSDEMVPLIGESSTFSVNIKDLHFPIPLKP